MPDIPSLGWEGVLWRLALAAVLGGLIGLERELDEKAAGVRTHMLVSVGSALFTIISAYGFHEFLATGDAVVRADPSRIAAQIVTGIGFLGAGVILRRGLTVTGLTTAATLWLVAAIGMAAGAGFWSAALIATAGALLSLRPLEWLKGHVMPQRRGGLMLVSLEAEASAAPVLDVLERLGSVRALSRRGPVLEVEVDLDRGRRATALTAVSEIAGVDEVRWA